MAGQERWSITVHDLVLTFRETLTALIPYMDKLKIGWRDAEAYDDWDDISQVLYKNMVLRSVQFSTEEQEDLAAPEYGMLYPSYADKSFIDVSGCKSQLGEYHVFVGFSTLDHPFDQVRYQTVSGPDLRATGEPKCLPLGEAIFTFVINKGDGVSQELSSLLIEV